MVRDEGAVAMTSNMRTFTPEMLREMRPELQPKADAILRGLKQQPTGGAP
jgi:hypothetical protein